MPNPNFPAELGSIPYEAVIGGPLNAAVEANAQASQVATQFISDVGFVTDEVEGTTEPVMVTFSYEKTVVDDEGNESTESFDLSVPLLLMLHVPYFEVEEVTIDFNVRLNSVQTFAASSKFNIDSSASGSVGFLFGRAKFSVNTSYQRQTSRGEKVERTYEQKVHVRAGSIEAPEGVKKLLGVLEEVITEEPQAGAPA